MRADFPSYYRPGSDSLSELWKNGIFVIDANILLNLYRYPKEARNDLLGILGKLADRLWLPYQAGLEYQRNRLSVIADQKKKYDDVRSVLRDIENKLEGELGKLQLRKRHSAIAPDSLLDGVKRLFAECAKSLDVLDREQQDVFDDDKIRAEIDALLEGKIGRRFEENELAEIYAEGRVRFDQKRPPGYMDEDKGKKDDGEFLDHGMRIRREFGDLLIWKQILREAQERGWKNVVYVTDDDSGDWWWIVASKGDRTVGPRPELVQEMTACGVSCFYMYSSERLMKFAKEYLGVPIRQESIQQVRDIAQVRVENIRPDIIWWAGQAQQAVREWVQHSYPEEEIAAQGGRVDFVRLTPEGRKIGYEVVFSRRGVMWQRRIRQRSAALLGVCDRGLVDEVWLVLVSEELSKGVGLKRSEAVDKIAEMKTSGKLPDALQVVAGLLLPRGDGSLEFKVV